MFFKPKKVSDVAIRRLFRRAVAPDKAIKFAPLGINVVRFYIGNFLGSLVRDVAASSRHLHRKFKKLAEEKGQKIVIRAIDCLMAVDLRHYAGLFRAEEAPSLLNICHSLGHRTLAMQLALGIHIDKLAAPHSVRQVDWSNIWYLCLFIHEMVNLQNLADICIRLMVYTSI